MSKKIIQDIYVVKKSIRMIKKNDVKDCFYNETKKPIIEEKKPDIILINKFLDHSSNNNEKKGYEDVCECVEEKKYVAKDSLLLLWIICIASIATLLFLLSSIFSTATVKVTPKNEVIDLNDTYNITSDKSVSTSTLHFEVMTLTENLSKNLEADGEEYVERKATGKAILYNNFSTASQRLINNTRLETKDGTTYRIRESVEIPGIKTVNGVKTPGSIEIDIIADVAGDKYNMKLSDLKGDFTIPGFQGSSKYTGFYGRLSSDITGGFIGNVKKVSDAKLTDVRTELQGTLKTNLIKDIYSKKPDQYVLFKDDYFVQCNDLADDSSNNGYKVSEECSINTIVFNKDLLSAFIAGNKINNFDSSKIDVVWNDNDIVTITGVSAKPWSETSLSAKFTGSAKVVWSFDKEAILNSIIGQNKSVISSVIASNKNYINEIQATIRPMWNSTFPSSEKKIKIIDTIRDSVN
jgi:hypothetical protein